MSELMLITHTHKVFFRKVGGEEVVSTKDRESSCLWRMVLE